MKICVISGRYPISNFRSAENHKKYCDKHGYFYINCSWPTIAKNPYFNKIYYIKTYIDLFDYIFWIDDDAFFIDFNQTLTSLFPTGDKIISICKSPTNKKLKTLFSSGTFLLKCSEKAKLFIDEVLNVDTDMVKRWWKAEYGFFTNGDQDAMIYIYKSSDLFKDSFLFFDYLKFNARYYDLFLNRQLLVVHLTGKLHIKHKTLRKIRLLLNVTDTLIQKEFDTYNYVNPFYYLKSHLKNSFSKIRSWF